MYKNAWILLKYYILLLTGGHLQSVFIAIGSKMQMARNSSKYLALYIIYYFLCFLKYIICFTYVIF